MIGWRGHFQALHVATTQQKGEEKEKAPKPKERERKKKEKSDLDNSPFPPKGLHWSTTKEKSMMKRPALVSRFQICLL